MQTNQKLRNGLADLGIEKMQEYLDGYAESVNKGEMPFSEALNELVEIEKKHIQARRDRFSVKLANFPFIKTMDDFDFSFQPDVNKKELMEINGLGFLDGHENIIFTGSSGVGKTHLATAVGISCARARYQTYFVTFENMMTQLKKALNENRAEARLKIYARYKVLIIDEIGYMPVDADAANLFFQLVAKRYERNSTIVTTNLPFSRWGELLGSPTLANAILDRLLHHSRIISIKGPSYRLKDKRSFIEKTDDEN